MTDVVLTLPIQAGEEAQLFGRFLNGFMESRSREAEKMAESSDAPFLMVHTDPASGQDVKVVTFQDRSVASAFSAGWARARSLGRSLTGF